MLHVTLGVGCSRAGRWTLPGPCPATGAGVGPAPVSGTHNGTHSTSLVKMLVTSVDLEASGLAALERACSVSGWSRVVEWSAGGSGAGGGAGPGQPWAEDTLRASALYPSEGATTPSAPAQRSRVKAPLPWGRAQHRRRAPGRPRRAQRSSGVPLSPWVPRAWRGLGPPGEAQRHAHTSTCTSRPYTPMEAQHLQAEAQASGSDPVPPGLGARA